MSTLDREPRPSGKSTLFCERRVDPGVPGKPMRVDGPSKLAAKIPAAPKPIGRMPVKR